MGPSIFLAALALLACSYGAPTPHTVDVPLGYTTLLRSSEKLGPTNLAFGQLLTERGRPVRDTVAATGLPSDDLLISNEPDFSSLLEVEGVNGKKRLFMVTHFEFPRPSAQYVVELKQEANGTLVPKSMRPVDWSPRGGMWIPCAGTRTPWMTHLFGEEYEPDARPFSEATDLASLKELLHNADGYDWIDIENFMRYFNLYPSQLTFDNVLAHFNPYRYGHISETTVQADGIPTVEKYYTLGRASWEMALVMPDQRTVYATDDGTNGGFFRFVADRPGDLTSGKLYAARFKQNSGLNGGAFSLSWIYLGKGDNDELKDMAESTKFSDIFEAAPINATTKKCPPGFVGMNQDEWGAECLKLKPGMAQAAAFLETRRYAAYKGATTEFQKWEGITFDPKRRQLYTSLSSIRYGMENSASKGTPNPKWDQGGGNHIRLPYNKCGCVYRLPLDRNFAAYSMSAMVCGRLNPNTTDYANGCDPEAIASPDNVHFIGDLDTLLIAEDSGDHENDVLWAMDMRSRSLTRILSAPYGAEVTSPYYYPNINGFSYAMAVLQHPYEDPFTSLASDPLSKGRDGYVGYLSWKAADVAGAKQATFQGIPYAQSAAEKHSVLSTPKVTIKK